MNVFQREFTPDIQATVVGDAEIKVESFSNIKCPFCGRELIVSGLEMPTENPEYYDDIHAVDSYLDGAGHRHTHFFGRRHKEQRSKIRMMCPARCIEDMKVNIKDVVISGYDKLREFVAFKNQT